MQIVEYVQLVVTSLDFDQSDSSLQVEKTQQGAFRIRHYIVKLGLRQTEVRAFVLAQHLPTYYIICIIEMEV